MIDERETDLADLADLAEQRAASVAIQLEPTAGATIGRGVDVPQERSRASARLAEFHSIYGDHADAVHASARWMCGSSRADDVTRAVFVDAWRESWDLEAHAGVLRTRLIVAVCRHVEIASQRDAPNDRTPDPHRGNARRRAGIERAETSGAGVVHELMDVRLLSDRERCALALIVIGDCSYHDVARLWNDSERNVLDLVRSALRHLSARPASAVER